MSYVLCVVLKFIKFIYNFTMIMLYKSFHNKNIIFITIFSLTFHICGIMAEGMLNEYCHAETFNPTCNSDEVILLESAAYGQMKIGRCIDGDYGYLGCTSNQLVNLDRKCSGKKSCTVEVEDSTMTEKINCSIPKTFTRYLEARFICRKVFQPRSQKCTAAEHISITSGKLNIASITTETTDCGLESKPWVLEAKPGQNINISLTDFKWNSQISSLIKCPVRYGYIIDVGINQLVDICGGSARSKHVYLSKGNSLQIIIDNNHMEETRFLLRFTVVGCPEFTAPKDTWTRVEDDKVITVGCIDNDKIWKMRCIGNHWIGIIGKCEKVIPNQENKEESQVKGYTVFGMSPVVGYSLIGGIFLVIMCVAVTTIIGYFCIRKPKSVAKEYYLTPMQYNSTFPVDTFPAHTNINQRRVHNDQHQTLLFDASGGRGTSAGSHIDNNGLIQNSLSPQYFVLEKRDESGKEPIYDAVYQNIGDPTSA